MEKRQNKKEKQNKKLVTIYYNQHCLLLNAHKSRLASDFTELFYNGNHAWLMAQDDGMSKSTPKKQRQTKKRKK